MRARLCPGKRRRRGLTLVELLITIALFGLISTYIAMLIKAGFGYLSQANDRAELQRSGLFVLNRLSKEIAESSPDCIRYAETGSAYPGLVFGTPRGTNDQVVYLDGHLMWKKWVCVYWDQASKLLVRVEEPFPADLAFKPDPSALGEDKSTDGFASNTGLARWVLARNVSNFSASGGREVRISFEVEVNEGERRSTLSTMTGIRPNH